MPTDEEISILLENFRKKINLRYTNKTSRLMFFITENLLDCIWEKNETEQEFVEQYRLLYDFLEEKERHQAEQIIEEILSRTKDDVYGKGTNQELSKLNKKILNEKTILSRQ